MSIHRDDYIPALKYSWLTSLYDPLLVWIMREETFKRELIRQARIDRNQRVLDLGSGTGTLTLLIKQRYPDTHVVGLDGDPRVLGTAKGKAARAGMDISWVQGMAFALPYPENTFDRVLSSLLLHHLTREHKIGTLREIFRVLRPGGEVHVADWGKPQNGGMRAAFLLVQLLDGFRTTEDHVRGLLPELITTAGFTAVRQTAQFMTAFGTLSLYTGRKPG